MATGVVIGVEHHDLQELGVSTRADDEQSIAPASEDGGRGATDD